MVEQGWTVEGADGEELGKVEETIGDPELDIFNGLTVSTGLLSRPRYVPAEDVAEIRDGVVRLSLSPEQFEQLEAYEEPPSSTPS